MIEYVSDCVDCGKPCLGNDCPHFSVKLLVCDKCNDEVDKLWIVDDEQVCEHCLKEMFETIED